MVLEIIKTYYEKNEKRVGIFALLLGFIVDSLTLRGVDQLIENIILIFYLFLTGAGIIVLHRIEKRIPVESERGRAHYWTLFATQFALGGLFSAFFVFYFRSASFEVSFPFLLILLFGLVANEVFKKKSSNLVFQSGIFFFALFSFCIFLVPTIFRSISLWTFLGSSVLTLLLFWGFLFLLSKTISDKYAEKKNKIVLACGAIFVFVHIFYFLNLIPPLPLVVKDLGVYHSIYRTDQGNYVLTKEKESFIDKLSIREKVRVTAGSPVYIWSAIYSPVSLDANVVHVWQKFDDNRNRWGEMSSMKIPLVGGRERGYRMYSFYPNVTAGIWRVDVTTERGAVMGRTKFRVIETKTPPQLIEEIK